MGAKAPPKPDPAGDYSKSLKTYLQYLPQLLGGEQAARTQYDPQRIQQQQGLQQQYGPTQYSQQLQALNQLDPQYQPMRQQLATNVFHDLRSGYNIPPDLLQQTLSDYRGAAAAHGGAELGNAPSAAEALYTGGVRNQLYQQHLQNAGNFLAGPTPEQSLLAVQPVAPDRASAYVNPSAPGQLAAPNYQNMLAQYQASGAGRSPWAGALGGAVGGAATGTTISPGYGTAIGAVAGGIAGYFSDARLKNHAKYIGRSPSGIPIHEFNYNECSGRWRGVIAQEILSIRPDAVTKGSDGYYRVDYDKIDVKLEEVSHAGSVV